MRNFTEADIKHYSCPFSEYKSQSIATLPGELVSAPLWYHTAGLQQTASGYGAKLNSGLKISFEGKLYRIYTTIFSNAGTSWFTVRGRRIIVR